MILAEITAAIDAAGTTTVLRYGTEGHTTGPAETPANACYEPRIKPLSSISRAMFAGGTYGKNRVGYGDIQLVNTDGGLDAIKDYGFDGRELVLRLGSPGAAYPSGWPVVFRGTIEQAEFNWKQASFRLRDKLMLLDRPYLQTRYAGTNSLPSGLEGEAQDLKGRPKPHAHGKVYNVSPPCVNTARLIYETGSVNTVDAGYDRGVALTAGADYTDQTDMETNAPTAGQYRAWPAGGYIRLGSTPAGIVTFDLTQGATAAARTPAQLLKQIALDMGVASGDISSADVTALDTANAAEVGIWCADESTALQHMDQLAASVGAWYGFDRLGVLRMGRLQAPSGTPAATLTETEILDGKIDRVANADEGRGLPVWRVTVNHSRNYTPQPNDLAGTVTDARRAWLALDLRATAAEDSAVKTQYLLAPELSRDTLLTAAADADTEAARLLALYKVKRETFKLTVRVDADLAQALDLGAVVELAMPRFGLDAGKLFTVIALDADYALNALDLTLWG